MTTQHTPGPWTTSSLPNGTEWTVSIDDGDMLADLTGCPNEQANARLIAAAPDLLAALQIAEDALDMYSGGQSSDLAAIRIAIDKATGAE